MRFKHELYEKEQNDIIHEILKILSITEEKNFITLYDIENNESIKLQLMELVPEIRKYFAFGKWSTIMNPDKFQKPYLTIVRQIPKKLYTITKKGFHFHKENEPIRTIKYIFQKNI
jgi:predicted transcriptional regulator